ncbi:hypothetical protein L1987_10546 [Smallanthus sonchifolius]|uniref:Uncharacterized protein n=1 Tax=Smallanthus sonchifolius TaxID=185202 RepID=A0ACB9JSD5_9ASTR|nr:hypothetical protein L1987_10546 [Smallanthus sonchifolius]
MATTLSIPLLMLSIFFILISILIPSFSCPSDQKQALLHFKSTLTTTINSSSYQLVELKSWNPTSDCCSWERVKCAGTKTVTELHLDGVIVPLPDIDPAPILSNILAPLFHIRSLKLLDISHDYLGGEIPGDGFVNLTALVHLDMQGNYFNSSIPRQLFWLTNLRYLDMSNNMLKGKLGPELKSLQKLSTLNLSDNYFQGPFPSQLFELKSLQVLDLYNNKLEGKLRPEMGSFGNLTSLSLGGNYFEGLIPSQFFKLDSLQVLDLSRNNLEGKLGPELGALQNLTTLLLKGNHFHGQIPDQLFEIKSLQNLDLSDNILEGGLSPEVDSIGRLPNMIALDLSHNKFTGQIPSSIQNLCKLKILRLEDNMFIGEIPTGLFKIMTLIALSISSKGEKLIWNNTAKIVSRCSLKEISMPYCGISGQIPEWISSHKELFYLDLRGNKLEGRFPYWLAERNMEIIFLSENKVNGLIPDRLFESNDLLILELSQNNFSGKLPKNIGNAKRISHLFLSENSFSGQIPLSISRIDGLKRLDLSKNRFSGVNFPVWGENSNLSFLDLSYNNFFCKIPVLNFPKGIRVLYLGGNKFYGNLPRSLTRLVNLTLLDLHENSITGYIQDTLPQITTLEALILRNNSLQGFIPNNISNLKSLRILDLSWNNLTGNIPQEMINLPRMIKTQNIPTSFYISHTIFFTGFENPQPGDLVVNWKKYFRGLVVGNLDIYSLLDLSGNKISGEIPLLLGNLKALKVLNISYNRIFGHIPVSFGNLEHIESLDLSHNKISGPIPQSLVKLRELTIIDVSNNMLTGKIPAGGQMGLMNELNSFVNNSGLCGMQINITCLEDIPKSEEREEEDETQSWFLWEGIWVGFPIGFFFSILIIRLLS